MLRFNRILVVEIQVFLCAVLLYLLNQFLLKKLDSSGLWFFRSYYNDVLAPILLFSYSNILIVMFGYPKYQNFKYMSMFIILVGLIWEYVAPFFVDATSDLFDFIAYYFGFLIYWCIGILLLPNKTV